MKLKISSTKREVALHFATYLAQMIASKEITHIALSGGSTPKLIFDELAENFQDDIDWDAVHIYWGDERCVPPTDAESNYKMTVAHLLSKIDIPEKNIHRIYGEQDPKDEAVRYSTVLEKELPKDMGLPQFDLVILGMGDDGHTASIFPHEIALWDAKNNCEVAVHPDSGQKRISITGQVINNAQEVAFLVTGSSKSEKVREILKKEGAYSSYPAALVAPRSGSLIWFLDAEAAHEIS